MSAYRIPPFFGHEFQIRLLRLSPKTATSSNATLTRKRSRSLLQGSLEVFDFDSAPPFIGLSYAWGSQDNKQPFLLNGDEVQITLNLAIALAHIRDEDEEVTLWVDALCIDQYNDQEKSDQVSRMRDIYKKADSVRIWLGPSSSRINALMDFLEKAGRVMVNSRMPTSIFPSVEFGEDMIKKLAVEDPLFSEYYLSEEVRKRNEALRDLTTREWWSRVWTLQEFVVAKDVVFQCGKKLLKLDLFEKAIIAMTELMHKVDLGFLQTRGLVQLFGERSHLSGRGRGFPINTTFYLRHSYANTQGIRYTMEYLLEALYTTGGNIERERKATDPRDKFYALLGLAQDSDSLRIIPDYKKSIRDIYTEVVGKVIAKDGLSLLRLCKYNPSSGLPSWVPDFRQGLVPGPNCPLDPGKEFCAGSAGIVTSDAHPLDGSHDILGVKGSCFGRVLDIGTSLIGLDAHEFNFGTTTRFFSEIEGFLLQSASMDICPYGAIDDDHEGHDPKWLQEARYRVPVSDVQFNSNWDKQIRMTASSKVGFDNLMELCRLDQEMTDQDERFDLSMHGFEKWGTYLASLYQNRDRKPFITTNGYVGVGPRETEVGDDIFIISGATVPYVLRDAQGGSRSILMGDAYVYGVMDGELVGKHPLIDLELE